MANNQKIADKKKVDNQEALEKSRADSAERSRDSYMKDLVKSHAQSCKSYMKDPEKSRADTAALVLHSQIAIFLLHWGGENRVWYTTHSKCCTCLHPGRG